MARLEWNTAGMRFYEAGLDRGVLYVPGNPGVPWNGLISVEENTSGGEQKSYYIDGVKYLLTSGPEEFEASISAFTYPDEFAQCDGSRQARSGLFLTAQKRKSFGLTYRTKIGNDQSDDHGYKIHIVYNALASPSSRNNVSIGDTPDPTEFSWDIKTKAPAISGYKRTAHVVIDSRTTDPSVLAAVEDILYGTDEASPALPTFEQLLTAYDTISSLTVVDNGDGTWTATAPYDVIRMLDDTTFEITASTAIFLDEESYTLSSE
jgi:hypothetical protein